MQAVKLTTRKYYKYIDTPFTQPVLTANGTMGGNSFACSSDTVFSPRQAWYAFNGTLGTDYDTFLLNTNSGSLYFYNPNALKISKITVTNRNETNVRAIRNGRFYGSNDNSTWVQLCTFTNTDFYNNGVWNINVNSSEYYKYFKFYMGAGDGSFVGLNELGINAVYKAIQESTSSDYDFYEDVEEYKLPLFDGIYKAIQQ